MGKDGRCHAESLLGTGDHASVVAPIQVGVSTPHPWVISTLLLPPGLAFTSTCSPENPQSSVPIFGLHLSSLPVSY